MKAADMLASAVARIEARYRGVDGPSASRAPTGEEYLTLVSGGIKPQGAPFPALYGTAEKAVEVWIECFDNLGSHAQRGGRLYWRQTPQLDGGGGRWTVYSRLLISALPVMSWDEWTARNGIAAIGASSRPLSRIDWNRLYGVAIAGVEGLKTA